jgi:hypothetical protein
MRPWEREAKGGAAEGDVPGALPDEKEAVLRKTHTCAKSSASAMLGKESDGLFTSAQKARGVASATEDGKLIQLEGRAVVLILDDLRTRMGNAL